MAENAGGLLAEYAWPSWREKILGGLFSRNEDGCPLDLGKEAFPVPNYPRVQRWELGCCTLPGRIMKGFACDMNNRWILMRLSKKRSKVKRYISCASTGDSLYPGKNGICTAQPDGMLHKSRLSAIRSIPSTHQYAWQQIARCRFLFLVQRIAKFGVRCTRFAKRPFPGFSGFCARKCFQLKPKSLSFFGFGHEILLFSDATQDRR